MLKKIIFLSIFGATRAYQDYIKRNIKNKTIPIVRILSGLRQPANTYQSINAEETFRKTRKLTLRLYATCAGHSYISFAELEAAR